MAFGLANGCGGDDGSRAATELLVSRVDELAAAGEFRAAAAEIERAIASADESGRPALWVRAAKLQLRAGMVEEALDSARQAIAAGESTPDMRFVEGESLRRLELPTEAAEVLEVVVRERPDHYDAALSLARLRARLADPADSIALFESYFRLATPDDRSRRTAQLEYGRALRGAGRLQQAADEFLTLLEDYPSERTYYAELSQTLYRLRRRAPAKFVESIYRELSERAFEEHVQEELIAAGRMGIGLAQTAINRAQQQRLLDAFRNYAAARKADADDPRIAIYFAGFCVEFLRYRDALAAIDETLARNPRLRSGLWSVRARVESAQGLHENAATSLRNALAALAAEGDAGGPLYGQADAADCELRLADALLALEKTHASTRDLVTERGRKASELRDALENLAERIDTTALDESSALYLELGDLRTHMRQPEALRCFLLAADLDPANAIVRKRLLGGLREPREFFVRLRVLRQLVTLEPDFPPALLELAGRYARLGARLEEAERLARRLHALEENADSYDVLIRVLAAAGKTDDARATAREGLARFHDDARLTELAKSLE